MSDHQFCKQHKSWFCPCVAGWLYSTAAKAAYLNNEPRDGQREVFEAKNDAGDEEQLDLLEETLR
jgi:hypothetical protein